VQSKEALVPAKDKTRKKGHRVFWGQGNRLSKTPAKDTCIGGKGKPAGAKKRASNANLRGTKQGEKKRREPGKGKPGR